MTLKRKIEKKRDRKERQRDRGNEKREVEKKERQRQTVRDRDTHRVDVEKADEKLYGVNKKLLLKFKYNNKLTTLM